MEEWVGQLLKRTQADTGTGAGAGAGAGAGTGDMPAVVQKLVAAGRRRCSRRTAAGLADGTLFVRTHPLCKHVAPPLGTSTRRKTTGTLLRGWRAYIDALRGPFKIGITYDPVQRSRAKWPDGTTYRTQFRNGNMVVLGRFETAEATKMAEAALISHYIGSEQCQNIALGGDGGAPSTVFLYVVVSEGNLAFL